jgi:hypothetical protein
MRPLLDISPQLTDVKAVNLVAAFNVLKNEWEAENRRLESERTSNLAKLIDLQKTAQGRINSATSNGGSASGTDLVVAAEGKLATVEGELGQVKLQLATETQKYDRAEAERKQLEVLLHDHQTRLADAADFIQQSEDKIKQLTAVVDRLQSISNGVSGSPAQMSTGGHAATSLTFDQRLVELLHELSQVWPENFPTDARGDRRVLIRKIRNLIDGLFKDTERDQCVDLLVQELRPVRPVNGNPVRQPAPTSHLVNIPDNGPVGGRFPSVPPEARGRRSSVPPQARDREEISRAPPEGDSPAARGRVDSNARGHAQLARMVGVSSLLQNLNDLCE